jgi:hypothetical protein
VPAETHQLGRNVDGEAVLELLCALLEGAGHMARHLTLEDVGVDDEDLPALWDSVCEEFAERSLGPDLELGSLETSMTLDAAAAVMAEILGGAERRAR